MPLIGEIARPAIAVIILASVSYVVFFCRERAAQLLQLVRNRFPKRYLEFGVALLSGLALLGLFLFLPESISNVSSFLRDLWAAPAVGLSEDQLAAGNAARTARIQIVTTAVQTFGGLAVLFGIYFAWKNLKITQVGQKAAQEAQKATQDNQTKTLAITNEGQITDRFTKAIDQLGSPQLELRLGGIYSLESIANESPQYHWAIMEVLTTYVRVHARAKEAKTKQSDSEKAGPQGNKPSKEVKHEAAPSADIQAILTVLGRRDRSSEYAKLPLLTLVPSLNLEKTDLEGASLTGADLRGANLNGADLSDADLSDAIGLIQQQIDSAIGDKDTKLPTGLKMPASWKKNP
jgi:hypothetical protein